MPLVGIENFKIKIYESYNIHFKKKTAFMISFKTIEKLLNYLVIFWASENKFSLFSHNKRQVRKYKNTEGIVLNAMQNDLTLYFTSNKYLLEMKNNYGKNMIF